MSNVHRITICVLGVLLSWGVVGGTASDAAAPPSLTPAQMREDLAVLREKLGTIDRSFDDVRRLQFEKLVHEVALGASPTQDTEPRRSFYAALIPSDAALVGRWPHVLDPIATRPLIYQPDVDLEVEWLQADPGVLYLRSNRIFGTHKRHLTRTRTEVARTACSASSTFCSGARLATGFPYPTLTCRGPLRPVRLRRLL